MAKEGEKTGINPLGAAIAGAAVGAAAVILSDSKNRQKLKAKVDDFKTGAEKTMNDIRKNAKEWTDEGKNMVDDKKEETKKKLDDTLDKS